MAMQDHLVRGARQSWLLVAGTFWLLLCSGLAAAEQADTVDLDRYVLAFDVPESPAQIALGGQTEGVMLGSAPKPGTLALGCRTRPAGDLAQSLTIDVAPYFLAGGGRRRLSSYRSNSLVGRMHRVLTKAILGLGIERTSTAASGLRFAWGVRATFHDPHDPVLNSALPESAAALLTRIDGVEALRDSDGEARDVPLTRLFARTACGIRRTAGIQVSAGYGWSGTLRSAAFSEDSLESISHRLWLSGQTTLGYRLDVLTTLERRSQSGERPVVLVGAGVLRKTSRVDALAQVAYDPGIHRLLPGLRLIVRAARGLVVSGGVLADRSFPRERGAHIHGSIGLQLFPVS